MGDKSAPWYEYYEGLQREVEERQEAFYDRCQVLLTGALLTFT
jgi:hypothetical protein